MTDLPVINMTNNSLNKGIVREGKQLIAWDCVQECDHNNCPLSEKCVYRVDEGEKCALQASYLQALTDTIFTTYRYLNEDVLFKIGMHLVPLYSQLCRQKIVEKAVVNLCYEDSKGVTRIHPIYKEIRETMKVITLFWKEIGFSEMVNPDLPAVGRVGFGNINHYNNISQNSDNKRDVIR